MNKLTATLLAVVTAAIVGTVGVQFAPQPAHAQTGGCAAAGAGSGGAAAGATNTASGQTCGAAGGVTSGQCAATTFFGLLACIGQ